LRGDSRFRESSGNGSKGVRWRSCQLLGRWSSASAGWDRSVGRVAIVLATAELASYEPELGSTVGAAATARGRESSRRCGIDLDLEPRRSGNRNGSGGVEPRAIVCGSITGAAASAFGKGSVVALRETIWLPAAGAAATAAGSEGVEPRAMVCRWTTGAAASAFGKVALRRYGIDLDFEPGAAAIADGSGGGEPRAMVCRWTTGAAPAHSAGKRCGCGFARNDLASSGRGSGNCSWQRGW